AQPGRRGGEWGRASPGTEPRSRNGRPLGPGRRGGQEPAGGLVVGLQSDMLSDPGPPRVRPDPDDPGAGRGLRRPGVAGQPDAPRGGPDRDLVADPGRPPQCRASPGGLTCTLDDWTNSLTPGAHVAGPLRATLRSLGKPVALLPGNHDRYGPLLSLPPYPPGNPAFDGVFGGSWQAGQGAQALWSRTKGGMTLVLLGADFTLRAGDWGPCPSGSFPSAGSSPWGTTGR